MQKHTQDELAKVDYIARVMHPEGKDPFGLIKVLYTLCTIFLGWLALPLEVFSRFSFGERYLNILKIALAYFTMQSIRLLFIIVVNLSNFSPGGVLFGGGNQSVPLGYVPLLFRLATIAFILISLLQLGLIRLRNYRGIEWHSMSFGISYLSLVQLVREIPIAARTLDWLMYRWIEPAFWIAIGGFIALLLDRITGIWLLIAAICLFLKNNMVYAEQRGRFLDIIDSRIESTYFADTLEGKPKWQTGGHSVVAVPTGELFRQPVSSISVEDTVKETLGVES